MPDGEVQVKQLLAHILRHPERSEQVSLLCSDLNMLSVTNNIPAFPATHYRFSSNQSAISFQSAEVKS